MTRLGQFHLAVGKSAHFRVATGAAQGTMNAFLEPFRGYGNSRTIRVQAGCRMAFQAFLRESWKDGQKDCCKQKQTQPAAG